MFDVTFISLNFDVGGSQRHTLDLGHSLAVDFGLKVRHIGTSVERPSKMIAGIEEEVIFLDRGRLGVFGMLRALFRELEQRPSRILVGINAPPMTAAWMARLSGVHKGAIAGVMHSATFLTAVDRRDSVLHFRAMKRLDLLVYVSEVQRSHWARYGLAGKHTDVIVNGIHSDRFVGARERYRAATRAELGLADDAYVIGFSARFRAEKNHQHLVEAVAHLRRGGIPAVALFVGDGPTRVACQAFAAQSGVTEHCLFVGEHEDVSPYLAAMDVGVLCSRSEAMPIAALEIMGTGIPVVLSRVGGAVEIVADGYNGYLYDCGDIPALTTALARLYRNPALRADMGQRARVLVQDRFDYARMVRAYHDRLMPLLG